MTLGEEQAKFLLDFAFLIQYASRFFRVTPGELERTIEQQKIYVSTGRSRTMNSQHVIKLAGDLNFFQGDIYINALAEKAVDILKPVGMFWESLDVKNVWGGNFDRDFNRKDPWIDSGHFQRNR